MATSRLLPLVQQAGAGLLDRIVPALEAAPMTRSAPAFAQPEQPEAPMAFPEMQAGGGRFVSNEDGKMYNGQNFAKPAPVEEPWYKRLMNDPTTIAKLGMGFNSMRLNPDQGLNDMFRDRIKTAGEMSARNMTAEKVSLALKNQGRFEEAALIESNPDMAKTVLGAMFTGDRAKSFKFESGGDLNTRLGTTVFDPKKPYKLSSTGEISEIGGSGTTITNTNQAAQAAGGKKYNQEWAVANVAFADEVNQNADNSAALLSQVSNIASNLQGLETGPFEERVAGLRAFAGSIGFPVDKIQLGREQSVTAAARQMVADQLRMNKGPQTDFDAKFAETYLPGFGKTEEANNQIIAYLRSTNKLNVIYANLMGGVAGNGYEEEREVIGRIRDLRRNVPAVAKKDGKWVQFSTYYDNIKSQDSSISDQEIITEWKKRAK
jgi:hypothetical protein